MNKRQDKVYHLDSSNEGQTLSAALKQQDAEYTWGQVKKWIGSRFVLVNGNLCLDEARRVQPTDVIKLLAQPHAKPVEVSDIRVAYHDEHLLIVEKPAGITSVRHVAEKSLSARRRQLQPTLEELLPRVLAKIQRLPWPPPPPAGKNRGRVQGSKRHRFKRVAVASGSQLPPELQVRAVHRLDRDTSGLMLFARTRQAEQGLIALFRRHKIQRQYWAVCYGQVEKQTLESYMVRDRGDGRRGSQTTESGEPPENSLRAVTHIVESDPIKDAKTGEVLYSKIRCQLETGRTHQIRIHLSEAGHPLCGDAIYFQGAMESKKNDDSGAPRHALHSDSLQLVHPITREPLSFKMQLPKDLSAWLKRITA